MKAVYRLTLPELNPRNGQHFFVNFETTYQTLDLLVADLNDGVVVVGSKLMVHAERDGRDKVMVVHARQPFAIGRHGVARIEPPNLRFVEYEEDERA